MSRVLRWFGVWLAKEAPLKDRGCQMVCVPDHQVKGNIGDRDRHERVPEHDSIWGC